VRLQHVVEIRHPAGAHRERLHAIGNHEDLAEREGHALAQRIGELRRGGIGPQLRYTHRAAHHASSLVSL
jgi:hypothetical protein